MQLFENSDHAINDITITVNMQISLLWIWVAT